MALVTVQDTVLHYNEVDFGPFTVTKIQCRPVYDNAGRGVKWVEITMEVEGVVEPSAGEITTDGAMEILRQRLERPRGFLRYFGFGFGTLIVNEGPFWDANFGPKPELLSWNPGGGPGAVAHVTWRVVVCLPQCDSALYRLGLNSFTFRQEHTLDLDRYSRLVVSGQLSIPMTTTSPDATRIPDHVDKYREKVQNYAPLGFTRSNFTWGVNEAKTEATFSWIDEELREPLPRGCTQAKFTHRVSSQGPTYHKWDNTISGNITVPTTVAKSWALVMFLTMMQYRVNFANAGGRSPIDLGFFGEVQPQRGRGFAALFNRVVLIPGRFEAANEAGGRGTSFSFSYQIIRRGRFEEMVALCGTWQPLAPKTDWRLWQESLRRLGVLGVRGPANVVWRPQDDAIIDPCLELEPRGGYVGGPDPRVNTEPQPRTPAQEQAESMRLMFPRGVPRLFDPARLNRQAQQQLPAAGEDTDGRRALPNPAATWLEYEMELHYLEQGGRYAVHQPLAGKLSDPREGYDPTGKARDVRDAQGGPVGGSVWSGATHILQEVGPPRPHIRLTGRASRIGRDIPLPNLLTVRGLVAKLNRVVWTMRETPVRWGDLRIERLHWDLEYVLDRPPRSPLPQLADPIQGLDGIR